MQEVPSFCAKKRLSKKHKKICKKMPPGDKDSCCETHTYATVYSGQESNLLGELCEIIHTTLVQMVTEGICGPGGSCNTVWPKSCQQEYTAHSLLAWNSVTETLGFEMFDIPTYCSCKNGP